MSLGELADRVDKAKYRDRTLAKLAKAIGYELCTLKRHRSVYRAWEGAGKKAPGLSYAVKRELQDHPEREAIVKANPTITKREAQEIVRAWKQQREGKQKKRKSGDGKAEERTRWLRSVCSFANKYGRDAEEVMGDTEATRDLREIAEPAVLAALGSDLKVLLALTELLQHQDEHTDKPERRKPHLKEAEGVAA
jgi:hypothetical protein